MPTLKLPTSVKLFVIARLALGESPQAIADMVKTNFDFEITRQCVNRYNPHANPRLHPRWIEYFKHTRKEFLKAVEKIPIFHKSYRLKQLQIMYEKAEDRGKSPSEIIAILEQAAKESGNFYGK